MVKWLGCLDRLEEVWLLMELMDQDLHSLLVSKRARCMRHAERYICTLHNPVGTIRYCRANKRAQQTNPQSEPKRNERNETKRANYTMRRSQLCSDVPTKLKVRSAPPAGPTFSPFSRPPHPGPTLARSLPLPPASGVCMSHVRSFVRCFVLFLFVCLFVCQQQIALAVARGMCEIHQEGLVHRDLKLHNILVDKACNARVADLGVSKRVRIRPSALRAIRPPVRSIIRTCLA